MPRARDPSDRHVAQRGLRARSWVWVLRARGACCLVVGRGCAVADRGANHTRAAQRPAPSALPFHSTVRTATQHGDELKVIPARGPAQAQAHHRRRQVRVGSTRSAHGQHAVSTTSAPPATPGPRRQHGAARKDACETSTPARTMRRGGRTRVGERELEQVDVGQGTVGKGCGLASRRCGPTGC